MGIEVYVSGGRRLGKTYVFHRYESLMAPFTRLLAHFDALDGDEEPETVAPRYELLHPEDSYPDIPDIVGYWNRRLFWTMLLGEDEYLRQERACAG